MAHNIKVGDSISPQFFTGFVQADGCFHVNIQKDSTAKHTIRLKPSFYVTQLNISSKKISPLLRLGRDLLQTGHYVYDSRTNCSSLCVNTLKNLKNNVLPHFEKYPLLSRKKKDYLVFKEIVEKMSEKLHLDNKVFPLLVEKIISMNSNGQYRKKYKKDSLFISTPSFDPALLLKRPSFPQTTLKVVKNNQEKDHEENFKNNEIPLDPQFVSGLFQGDGSFSFRVRKTKKNKKVAKVAPFFTLGQEKSGIDLLEKYKNFFKSGTIYPVSLNYSRWMVSDFFSLKENVLPHFKENPLIGLKQKDFLIFSESLDILTRKECCKKERIEKVVELCYDLNMGGKRRRLPKEEYLRAIAS